MTMKSACRSAVTGRICKLVLVAVILSLGVIGSLTAVSADPGWRGEYYNNVTLSGTPAVVRTDANVDFDWGWSAPASGVNLDLFSVRWTAYTHFGGGDYMFRVTSDDGVRLWVDDQLIIDQWHNHPATTYSAVKHLSTGSHSVRLEYYDNTQAAVCKLWWEGGVTPGPITEWRGEYFNDTWLGSGPVLVRNDSAIHFNWGWGSPDPSVNADNFSVRWTRDVYFGSSANHTFYATVDDGVRLWVDGAIVIDRWYPQAQTTHSGTVYLGAGTHQVRVEYFDQGGVALCQVSWTGGGTPAPGPGPGPSPNQIIVDDRDAGFTWGGVSSSWYGRNTGYRGHLYWTWNGVNQLHNWAKWFPHVPTPGNWEVYVYIASRYHGSKNARYQVHHSGTRHDQVVNQNIYNNQWVSLGTYHFGGGGNEYVYLGDNTGEAYATRFVGFDAVKFVRRDGSSPPPPHPPGPPSGCSITPILGFGRVWNNYPSVRNRLGCATGAETATWAAEESFEHGYMYWRQDDTFLYVLNSNGTWQGYDDTWTSAEPEWDASITPPWGLYQPKRGFGKVWRDNSSVRSGLGWATTEERGFHGSIQRFEHGMMLWSDVRGIFVLYSDGHWEHRY